MTHPAHTWLSSSIAENSPTVSEAPSHCPTLGTPGLCLHLQPAWSSDSSSFLPLMASVQLLTHQCLLRNLLALIATNCHSGDCDALLHLKHWCQQRSHGIKPQLLLRCHLCAVGKRRLLSLRMAIQAFFVTHHELNEKEKGKKKKKQEKIG